MVTLDKILPPLLEIFPNAAIGSYDPATRITHAEFLQKGSRPEAYTLYLADSNFNPDPSAFSINGQPVPILQIRKSALPQLMEAVQARLDIELRLQMEANELYQILYAGSGLDELAIKAESFLQKPISVLDPSYRLMTASPMMRQLPFGMSQNAEGLFLTEVEVESLRRLQIERKIYQHNSAFFINTEDHPDTNWIFCAIRIQHVMSGYIAVCLSADEEASEYQLRLTNIFSDVCAIEMQKQDFYQRKTGMQYESFFVELLEGRYTDVNIIQSRLRMLNKHFGKFFCLAVLYSAVPHNSDRFNAQQMANLRRVYENSMSVVYENNIVLLINQDTPVMLNEDLLAPLYKFADQNNLKVSISQPFADIMKITHFYAQAMGTMELSLRGNSDRTVFMSTDALPEYLFSKCNYVELETGIHYHIFQLNDYDKEYHTDLVDTLRALIKYDRNATQAAEALHIHRSTFFYRIKKIEEVLDISLTDGKLLFLYELSFKIWDYLSQWA